MKNKTTLTISFLFIIIILLSIFLYKTQKKLNDYVKHVELSSAILISANSLQSRIDDIEKLKSDTTADYRGFIYKEIDCREGMISTIGGRFFALVAVLHRNGKNEKEINKLIETYSAQTSNIRWFLLRHNDFTNISKKDADTLASYYKKLKNITEQVEKMKIEP